MPTPTPSQTVALLCGANDFELDVVGGEPFPAIPVVDGCTPTITYLSNTLSATPFIVSMFAAVQVNPTLGGDDQMLISSIQLVSAAGVRSLSGSEFKDIGLTVKIQVSYT